MTGTAQQMYSVAAGGAAEAIASLRIDAQSDLHTLETIAALDWIQSSSCGSLSYRSVLSLCLAAQPFKPGRLVGRAGCKPIFFRYELSGDSSKFRLLLSQQLIILTRHLFFPELLIVGVMLW